ncbi:MAG: hypothetical protein HOV68_23175 [Streptomycetaceae bacterium]|nr:hypothetical protein [Streptomycetaceae bacterium]
MTCHWPDRPPIVCLCGSTRFWDEMAEVNRYQTAAGRIVLAPGIDMKRPHPLWSDPAAAEALKTRLDRLHLAKISLADEVIVVAPGGYIGESTRREIDHADRLGKTIRHTWNHTAGHTTSEGDQP